MLVTNPLAPKSWSRELVRSVSSGWWVLLLSGIVSIIVATENPHRDVDDTVFIPGDDVLEGSRIAAENQPNGVRDFGSLRRNRRAGHPDHGEGALNDL